MKKKADFPASLHRNQWPPINRDKRWSLGALISNVWLIM